MKNIIFAFFCISMFSLNTYGQSEIRMTNENENTFKAYIDSTDTDPVEGIYKSVSGTFYRLAIKKVNDNYIAIILDAEDKRNWKIGKVKAYLEKSSAENFFSIRWLMGDKTPKETIGRLESQAVLKILLPTGAYGSTEETIFLKLYPNNKTPETQKSNSITVSGSGFFITSNGKFEPYPNLS